MKELFENLGVNERQMQAFLKLLELGVQPVSVIAKHVGVPRTTMYSTLDELKKLGLIEEFEKAGIRYYRCIPVENLRDLLEAKMSKVAYTMELLANKLPSLLSLENKLSVTPKVKFYEGKDAVMKLYEEVLKEKGFYAFFNPQVDNPVMKIYFDKVEAAIRKGRLRVKEFVTCGPKGKSYLKKYGTGYHKIKILPKDVTFDADNIICENKIYMISYGDAEVSGIEIFSQPLAFAHRVMFEQLWGRY